jgi:hypothetical protein
MIIRSTSSESHQVRRSVISRKGSFILRQPPDPMRSPPTTLPSKPSPPTSTQTHASSRSEIHHPNLFCFSCLLPLQLPPSRSNLRNANILNHLITTPTLQPNSTGRQPLSRSHFAPTQRRLPHRAKLHFRLHLIGVGSELCSSSFWLRNLINKHKRTLASRKGKVFVKQAS